MTQGTTVSLRQIYRCQVLNQKQELVGTVDDVLFHPTLPRAVGFSVKPFRLAGIVALPTKYLLFENAQFNSEGQLTVVLDGEASTDEKQQRKAKVAWDARAEKQLGFTWDESVIYYGQQVFTESEHLLGKVSDARFDLVTGKLSVLQVTAGTTSDTMLGKRNIPGKFVHGFNNEIFGVVCANTAEEIELDGGMAEQAGKAAAEAADVAAAVGKKAGDAAIKGAAHAVVYGERTLKRASQSEAGKKTKKWFTSFVDDFKDAMNEDDR